MILKIDNSGYPLTLSMGILVVNKIMCPTPLHNCLQFMQQKTPKKTTINYYFYRSVRKLTSIKNINEIEKLRKWKTETCTYCKISKEYNEPILRNIQKVDF